MCVCLSSRGNTKQNQNDLTIAVRTGRHFVLLFVVHEGVLIKLLIKGLPSSFTIKNDECYCFSVCSGESVKQL